jgi:hypothetical protein
VGASNGQHNPVCLLGKRYLEHNQELIMYKIMQHMKNQHGYSVSLIKYEDDELVNGFVLISHNTLVEQAKYVMELAEMTGWQIEEGF